MATDTAHIVKVATFNPIDSLDILLAKKGLPTELVKIVRDNCPNCDHCGRRTPFRGKLIKLVTWSGQFMTQRRYYSVYHKKSGDCVPDEASSHTRTTCYNCSDDFIHQIAFKYINCLYDITHSTRQWVQTSILNFTRYDSRLHAKFTKIITDQYPNALETYLVKYDYLVNFTRV